MAPLLRGAAPKRPRNAYTLYCSEARAQVTRTLADEASAEHGEAKPPRLGEVTKALAAAWRELDDDARAPFDARAAEERERYAREKERIANTWAG